MRKTFEYRLYPNRLQRVLLMACLAESRHLYNEMLETIKGRYTESGIFLSKYELMGRFKGRGGKRVPATTVQTLADRLDKALRRFVARRSGKEQAGFPRFKSANRWHSITLRQWGKDVRLEEGRLRVPKKLGKSIKIKQHTPTTGRRAQDGLPQTQSRRQVVRYDRLQPRRYAASTGGRARRRP